MSSISGNSWAFEESFVNTDSLQKMENSMNVLLESLSIKEEEVKSMQSPPRKTPMRKRSDKLSPLARFATESLQQQN